MKRGIVFSIFLLSAAFLPKTHASVFELFAKGSYSKSYVTESEYTVRLEAATGLAVNIASQIRIEGRYINRGATQNKIEFTDESSGVVYKLSDIKTQSTIYSLGLSIDFFDSKSAFQPFLFLGAGYLIAQQTYSLTVGNSSTST